MCRAPRSLEPYGWEAESAQTRARETTLENKICVLIDFENVAAGTEKEGLGKFDIRAVMRRLKDKGRILVARSYGDWGRFAKFKQQFLEQGITMVEMTSYRGQDKNRADIALVVDAMELAFTRPYIDTFILLSGDSDFTPVVMRLKELDRRVIGMGTRGSTSRLLVESCDEFIFYESVKKKSREERQPRESASDSSSPARTLTKKEAFDLLGETVEGILKEDPGEILAGLVKQSMLRKEPAFDETEYGFTGFTRFLEAGRDKGVVRLTRDNRSGGFRVDLPGGDAPAPRDADADPRREGDAGDEGTLPVPEGPAAALIEALAGDNHHPLTHFIRHTVVHEFVDHVSERERRKKRNTLMYVYGDIARRCRKTDPYVAPRQVKQVINTLKAAGLLLHVSGAPVRSQNASFVIRKDAEEILVALRRFYISQLAALGQPLSDSAMLSQLLWGDEEHAQECEELVAWVQHERTVDAEEAAKAADTGDKPSTESAPPAASEAAPAPSAPPAPPEEAAPAPPVEAAPAEPELPRAKARRAGKNKVLDVITTPEAPPVRLSETDRGALDDPA